MSELKPCPFCGGKPSIKPYEYPPGITMFYTLKHTCKKQIPQFHIYTHGSSKKDVMAYWNRRAE